MSGFVKLYKTVKKKGDQDHPLFEPGNYKEATGNIK